MRKSVTISKMMQNKQRRDKQKAARYAELWLDYEGGRLGRIEQLCGSLSRR